jgi:hypothetical protein
LIQIKAAQSAIAYDRGTYTIMSLPQSERTMEQPRATDARRLAREKCTIRVILALHCRAHHAPDRDLCPDCDELLHYALCRLDRCPFGAAKTVCARCPIHCYSPSMRTRIRAAMRYAGPRMAWRHPLLALRHWFDGLRGTSVRALSKDDKTEQ